MRALWPIEQRTRFPPDTSRMRWRHAPPAADPGRRDRAPVLAAEPLEPLVRRGRHDAAGPRGQPRGHARPDPADRRDPGAAVPLVLMGWLKVFGPSDLAARALVCGARGRDGRRDLCAGTERLRRADGTLGRLVLCPLPDAGLLRAGGPDVRGPRAADGGLVVGLPGVPAIGAARASARLCGAAGGPDLYPPDRACSWSPPTAWPTSRSGGTSPWASTQWVLTLGLAAGGGLALDRPLSRPSARIPLAPLPDPLPAERPDRVHRRQQPDARPARRD